MAVNLNELSDSQIELVKKIVKEGERQGISKEVIEAAEN